MEKVIRDANGCKDFTAIISYPNETTQIPSHYKFTYTLNGNVIIDEFDNVNPDNINSEIDDVDVVTSDSGTLKIISKNNHSEEVVIKNNGSESINLEGYKLISVTGNQKYIFPDFLISAGDVLTVYSGKGSGDLKWTGSYIWNNDGDKAELYDNSGILLDTLD